MLTEAQIKNAKPKEKRYMLRDEHGLYLEIIPSGTKSWRFRYWIDKKEHKITIGKYPLISLKDARERRDKLRIRMVDGDNPVREQPQLLVAFETAWLEWTEKKVIPTLTPAYAEDLSARARNHILPFLGKSPITDITSVDVLRVLRRIEATGHIHMAHRVCQICGRVFRYAIASGYCENDPTGGLKGALQTTSVKHQASITKPEGIGALLRSIEGYNGLVVRYAMMFQAYTFVRPGELRRAEWNEIDMDKKEWRIPENKMKMRRTHIVPLALQAIAILDKIKPITGHGRFIFPSGRTPDGSRPMSENAVTASLRRMGFDKDEMTGHGFRSMASTLLNENGFNVDWIERQLAHIEGNSVRAAYNYAEYLPERRRMMQWWADYLDELRAGK
ncbi:MAG: integrase arm-type DNA-binding domain-containing protein [Synergistaceae bacterium]|jgi:integrase|nr:integrase arm-type DNA-binding domain-containing protein [Synergistaceae bacterium]